MRFLRQNQFVLIFLGLLVLCGVMVLHELHMRESAHVERRENFLLAHERNLARPEQRLYQLLIQELPELSDRALANDLERSAMLLAATKPEPESLLWKFNISVGNELRKRAERRLAKLQQEPENQ